MADKEERILVLTTHNKDGECECVMQDGCHANDSCAICNVGVTREHIIDKMKEALCNWYYTECSECALRDKPKECKTILNDSDFYYQAEAALNALLEEQK